MPRANCPRCHHVQEVTDEYYGFLNRPCEKCNYSIETFELEKPEHPVDFYERYWGKELTLSLDQLTDPPLDGPLEGPWVADLINNHFPRLRKRLDLTITMEDWEKIGQICKSNARNREDAGKVESIEGDFAEAAAYFTKTWMDAPRKYTKDERGYHQLTSISIDYSTCSNAWGSCMELAQSRESDDPFLAQWHWKDETPRETATRFLNVFEDMRMEFEEIGAEDTGLWLS